MALSWTFLWTRWELAALDWTGLATLITGVLAVRAARDVGRKQADILKQQNELKANEIKLELLDRRFEIIKKISLFSDVIYANGDKIKDQISLVEKLIDSLRLAELIYPQNLHEDFRGLIDRALRLRSKNLKISARSTQMSDDEFQNIIEGVTSEEIAIGEAVRELARQLIAHARVDL